ncbi:MAG: PQQ-binding-like beta-propeller repeat protein, partial [Verrucomicrobiota bacterium]
MKNIFVGFVIALAGAGCATTPQPEEVTPAPPTTQQRTDAIYSGKPLSYWLEQAQAEKPAEDYASIQTVLKNALLDEREWVQAAAADTLMEMGPKAAPFADEMVGLMTKTRPWVMVALMDALANTGSGAVPALVKGYEGGGRTGFLSVLILGLMGPPAEAALPTLREAQKTATGGLKARLPNVIASIEGKTPSARMRKIDVSDLPSLGINAVDREDWPQFHGPQRDGLSRVQGLNLDWPEAGPPLLWSMTGMGKGYSSISIVDQVAYTMGDRSTDGPDAGQYLLAFDLEKRRPLWSLRVGDLHSENQPGARCTPTVDGNRVYALGTSGDLVCANALTGDILWQKNLADAFEGKVMAIWKYSESPLIDGDKLICTPGGPEAELAALNKMTGEVIWTCDVPDIGERGQDGAGYSSIVKAEIAGVPHYVQMIGRGVVGVEADTGKFLWGYNGIANNVANITAPVVRGDYVFATTSYKTGSVLLKIV